MSGKLNNAPPVRNGRKDEVRF